MAQVSVGDQLIDARGRPTTVLAVSAVLEHRPCYAVEFSDGSVIVADGEHRWLTHTHRERRSGRPPRVVTTEEIRATLRTPTGDARPNHSVPHCRPLALPARELPAPPYAFGARLGARPDASIPPAYLRGSEAQRRALLAGLLDAGGTVSPTGRVHYPATSHRLAEQVRELVVSLGYRCPLGRPAGRGKPVAGHLVSFGTGDDVFRDEPKLLAHKQRRRPGGSGRTGPRSIVDVRRVASVPVRCVAVDNPEHLYLAGRAMIPTHNSAASLDFARHAAVRHGLASAIFSLEMSKVEIVMRVLAAEARVPLHVLRSGQLSDEDWTKLARRMGEISEAPLFLDDTPNMTLMEIRAKARRLRQRHDLKLVVVDYLQLMTSPKRVESRQQEVSELSRGLKLLAKEIDCPVIGVAQLNRGPEQRTDKRPQLSDLRESGCLTAATRLVRADTNQEVTLGELVRSGATDVPVWSLDERLRYVPARLTHAFPSGRKQVFRLRLGSGREVAASANHPFLGYSGWVPLAELGPGDRVAVMRRLPGPPAARAWPREEVLRAARLARVPEEPIPDGVFALPTGQVALFLRQLWAAGGSAVAGSGGIRYRSASRRLLDGVAMLLLRFGIVAGVREVRSGPARGQHTLEVSGRDDQLRFLGEIGGRGAASGRLPAGLVAAPGDRAIDTVPGQLRTRVRELLAAAGVDHREPAAAGAAGPGGRAPGRCRPGRQPLARIAAVLDSADLELHATNDVCWDRVVSVEPLGEQQVYDATVPVTHNFVANGVAVHNSIEQDADVVILLHRDDYYDKESPRAGEADFIVAKHRNGPTDTVTVAAQLHFSRFVDMAIG
jgi:replicative DNA helicase